MISDGRGRTVNDDGVVELPAIDLGAGPSAESDAAPSAGTIRQGPERRWVTLALILVIGAALGMIIADMRADAKADHTVSLHFGGYDLRPWYHQPGEPIDAGLQILNTGRRELTVVGLSVPGLGDEDIGSASRRLDDGGRVVPPGEWVTIPIRRHAECGGDDPRSGSVDASSITVTAELDGRRTQVAMSAPASATTLLFEAVDVVCAPPTQHPYVGVTAVEIGSPRDGELRMRWQAQFDTGPNTAEISAITSTMPGFSVEAEGVPVSFGAGDAADFDVVWTVDCAGLGYIGDVSVVAEVISSDGDSSRTTVWLGPDVTFALGGLAATTCPGEVDGS